MGSVNVSWAPNHILIISEGSCDTEDWSNNCWQLYRHRNKLHFKMYLNRKLLFKNTIELLCHNITVFTVFFWSNQLVSIRDFFQKKLSDLRLYHIHSCVYSFSVTSLNYNVLYMCPNPVLNVWWIAELSPCSLPCILYFIQMYNPAVLLLWGILPETWFFFAPFFSGWNDGPDSS